MSKKEEMTPSGRSLNLTFDGLSYSVRAGILKKENRQLLTNISGDFRVGELTAIMGPSGAGKSTFLDILAGFTIPTTGTVLVNGSPRDLSEFRRNSAYIMQNDNLEPLLTVEESLRIAAELKLQSNHNEKIQRVDQIISALGLDTCRHTRTCSLSGGQRKRLAIALELVNNPPVMFFDEPTSGLDIVTSKQCISLLKALAREGPRTVVVTIHQPSATLFDMMDHLYVIVDGYCVYTGGTKPLLSYLAKFGLHCPTYHNPADFLMEICNGDYGKWNEKLVESINNGKCNSWRSISYEKDSWGFTPIFRRGLSLEFPESHVNYTLNSKQYATGFFKQLYVLVKRNAIKLSRDRILTFIRLGMHCIIAIIVGIIYFDIGEDAAYALNNFNLLFFSLMFLMFSAFSATIITFPLVLPIISREHFNRWYKLRSFYIANKLADLPIQVVAVSIYTLIVYLMTGQILEGKRFILLSIACVVVSLVAQIIGVIVGTGLNMQNGVIFGSLFIMPFVIFSGFFVHINDAPPYLQWLFHASFLKYGFECAMTSMYGFSRPKMLCSDDYCHFISPQKLMKEFGMIHVEYWFSMIILLFLYLVLDLFAYVILRLKLKKLIFEVDEVFIFVFVINMNETNDENGILMPPLSSPSCTLDLERAHNKNFNISSNEFNDNFHINIDFKDLIYSVKTRQKGEVKKEILHGINGYFNSKSLNAIIGPSGAGKTSLISILCGFKNLNIQGTIRINGISSNSDTLRKISCYVPQEFELLPWLTTKETLYFATRLKISKMRQKYYQEIVNNVADKLGLADNLETMTQNLSGGEKKRLSIGVEIVTNPMVLILDEPTSGLDSLASSQVIALLKNMSQNGCNVICSVHQPSSQMMTMFDNLLVLANGRELYCGPQTSVISTFERAGFNCPSFYNIGEYVIEVATERRIGDLDLLRKLTDELLSLNSSVINHKFLHEPLNTKEIQMKCKNHSERRSITWTDELRVLLWRAITCIRRDNTMTRLRLLVHVLVGILLGIVFQNFGEDAEKTPSNIASLFFFLLFLFFSNAMPAVQMFPIEAAVFIREHSNNWYSLGTYYISKVITDLPLQILCPTCFLIIAYCLTGQPLEFDRFIKVWLMCFLMSILAQSFGILTGAAFNTHVGCFLVPALNIPMFLFAGFFIKLNEISSYLYPLSAISFFRYAFEGILQAIYDNDRPSLTCKADFCLLKSPRFILSYMDMPSVSFTTITLSLLIWIICLHCLIFLVLKCKFINLCKK
ncbi:uncharacterized ABC transporter ATP-binding protein/permease YOL075C-like [Chelonus insularis]|uniref:uncharacterized ABC transporter ATP-binding protein/permease YOL075C-like n=1 Tax=Chelonus insularis TaxID=460826 RepID=UPI00158D9C83|nr:uncharacterized ABC transporter ATP-binding protein/permease YOL075C-like [Chelonus insularis]